MIKNGVSVIVPVYNSEKYLVRFINSLSRQSLSERYFEVLFIDDGSNDESANIIRSYCLEFSNFHLISQENSGAWKARNTGLREAQYPYVYFCDPDDFVKPNLLLDNLRISNENSADLVYFGFDAFNEKKGKITFSSHLHSAKIFSNKLIAKNFKDLFYNGSFYTPWNKFYKTSFLLQNHIFFESHSLDEDAFFNLKVWKKVQSLVVNPKIYYRYTSAREGSAQTSYSFFRYPTHKEVLNGLRSLLNFWGIDNPTCIFSELVGYKWDALNYFYYNRFSKADFINKARKLRADTQTFKACELLNRKGLLLIAKNFFAFYPSLFYLYKRFRK